LLDNKGKGREKDLFCCAQLKRKENSKGKIRKSMAFNSRHVGAWMRQKEKVLMEKERKNFSRGAVGGLGWNLVIRRERNRKIGNRAAIKTDPL